MSTGNETCSHVFVIALRQTQAGNSTDTTGTGRLSTINFGILTIQDVVGNLGEPLEVGEDGHDSDLIEQHCGGAEPELNA